MFGSTQRKRSFVRRDSRQTKAQSQAIIELWPEYGLSIEDKPRVFEDIFGRDAPCFLEIGFGNGQSLLALAQLHPDKNFIGIETHKPGIGTLLLGIKRHALANLKIYAGDAVEIITECLADASLQGVQIFFPDPWPKRRHHDRRLIQPLFLNSLIQKIKLGGSLHFATDWEDYAKQMMRVLSAEKNLENNNGPGCFGERSPYRPIITKFEQQALRAKRQIWELQFQHKMTNHC